MPVQAQSFSLTSVKANAFAALSFGVYHHRQITIAANKARLDPLRRSNDFNVVKALQDFLP